MLRKYFLLMLVCMQSVYAGSDEKDLTVVENPFLKLLQKDDRARTRAVELKLYTQDTLPPKVFENPLHGTPIMLKRADSYIRGFPQDYANLTKEDLAHVVDEKGYFIVDAIVAREKYSRNGNKEQAQNLFTWFILSGEAALKIAKHVEALRQIIANDDVENRNDKRKSRKGTIKAMQDPRMKYHIQISAAFADVEIEVADDAMEKFEKDYVVYKKMREEPQVVYVPEAKKAKGSEKTTE